MFEKQQIIEIVKLIFIKFYGIEYESLINDRMKSLVDIIFYDNTVQKNDDVKELKDYLIHYNILSNYDNILNGKIPFSRDLIKNGEQGMMLFLDDDTLKTVIYFPNRMEQQYNYDCILIHELMHVLEEYIFFKDENTIIARGGFETMVLKGIDEEEREYEYFNEIIHQRIAEDITSFAHNQGIYVINDEEDSKISDDEYKKDRCEAIELFYTMFKNDLINAKLTGNTEIFIDKIGKNNFEDFNQWMIQYFNKYPIPEERKQLNLCPTSEYCKIVKKGIEIVHRMNVFQLKNNYKV